MTAVPEQSTGGNLKEEFGILSTGNLLTHLRELAYRKRVFREQVENVMGFSTHGGNFAADDSQISNGQTFEATRFWTPAGSRVLNYALSSFTVCRGIAMPPHIAVTGFEGWATAGIQLGTEQRIELGAKPIWINKELTRFSISTHNRSLDVCEEISWEDDEGSIVHAACSCGLHGIHEELNDDLLAPPEVELDPILQALELSPRDRAEREDEDLRQAFFVVSSIKQALREQAGVG